MYKYFYTKDIGPFRSELFLMQQFSGISVDNLIGRITRERVDGAPA